MSNRIHLCIIQPPGHIHSQAFLDQARYARYQFRRLGAEVSIAKNRLREDAVNLIFGSHLGFSPTLKDRYICVFVNLELLDRQSVDAADYLHLLSTSAVIDCERSNLAAYGARPGDVPIVSFLWAPYLAQEEPIPLENRPIDLLCLGHITEVQQRTIARIEACGWSVSTFDHPLYGDERDPFIVQSKAVLHGAPDGSARFSHAHAFHSLSLGTPLIAVRAEANSPPAAYANSVTWLTDESLESFFKWEFMTPEWVRRVSEQRLQFSSTDPLSEWKVAYQFCEGVRRMRAGDKAPWRPSIMNLGSGKDYRLGWLNVDVLQSAQPDLVLDLGVPLRLPFRGETLGGGTLEIEANSLTHVYANNVLEHVPDLPCLMTNLLALLKEDGEVEIEVPYERAPTAWQDPTHVRAMNSNSWLYYTSWFWYLGWFESRFEAHAFQWLDGTLKPCNEPSAAFMRLKLRKVPTTPHERSVARAMQADFGGLKSDTETLPSFY